MYKRLCTVALVWSSCLSLGGAARAQPPYQVIDLPAGAQTDLYFQVNVTGKLYVRLAARDGKTACANLWWVKWPFGTVEQLGRVCDRAAIDIPALADISLSSRLRAGGVDRDLKALLTASEAVFVSPPPFSFP